VGTLPTPQTTQSGLEMRFRSLSPPGAIKTTTHASALFLLGAALTLSACPVDDRTLVVSLGSSGEQNRAGSNSTASMGGASVGASSGSRSDGGAAGEAGDGGDASGEPRTFPDGCTDLDRDNVSDCTQTLVQNPAFAHDAASWTAESGATLAWDPRDLLGISESGSALVTSSEPMDASGDSLVAVDQCISVTAGTILGIFANAVIDPGQVAGRAAINLWFFGADGCPGGSPMVVYETPEEFETGTVLTLRGSTAVIDGMHSVRVRLGVIKPSRAESFSVRFDNVLIRKE
jgi:hypothetical protein